MFLDMGHLDFSAGRGQIIKGFNNLGLIESSKDGAVVY